MTALIVLRCDATDALGDCGQELRTPGPTSISARRYGREHGWTTRRAASPPGLQDICPVHSEARANRPRVIRDASPGSG